MVVSAYLSLLDDWDILQPALRSVIDRVDEIIVVDGAYRWMLPYFAKSGRDPSHSLPQVYDALAALGPKIRVIRGVWENEMDKRIAGYAACAGRYRYRVDADEIFFFNEDKLRQFFDSAYAVGQMEMPTYIVPGLVSGAPGQPLPRQSFLFDSDKISAAEHLSYLWLVLPAWERAKCGEPRGEMIFPDSLAFNAHLTHWRPPSSALARARFYIMNYMRQHGGPAFAGAPPGQGIADFAPYFEHVAPAAFDEMLLGRALIVLPAADQIAGQPTKLSAAQEESFAYLHEHFLTSLAALNHNLLAGWRTIARGEQYFLDATRPGSLPVGPNNLLAFEFSTTIAVIKVHIAAYFSDPSLNRTQPLNVGLDRTYAAMQLPALPDHKAFLRRTLVLTIWPQDEQAIFQFRARALAWKVEALETPPPPPAEDLSQRRAEAQSATDAQDWASAARLWAPITEHPAAAAADYLRAGDAFVALRDFAAASVLLGRGHERFPNDIWIGRLWGIAAKWAGDPAEAARRFAAVRTRQDADFLAAEQADCLYDAGDAAAAEAVLHEALQLFPDSRWVNLAWVRIPAKQRDAAALADRWRVVEQRVPAPPDGTPDEHLLQQKIETLLTAGAYEAARQPFRQLDILAGDKALHFGPFIVGWKLCADPLTIISAVYSFDEVVRPIMQFRAGLAAPVFFFFGSNMSLVFHHELRERLPRQFHALSAEFPNAHITFMTNEVAELRLAQSLGMRAVLVNNNAFVDTARYVIQPHVKKTYDAVYNARFMPYKRPELASAVARLRLVMAGPQSAVWAGVEKHARAMFPDAEINAQDLDAAGVVAALNSAACGLCLSAAEGAMYAAIEYMLCGLPIVTTRNVGGRDWWLSDDTAIWCDPDPHAVAAAVETLLKRQIDPEFIRTTALERIRRERLHFINIVGTTLAAHGFDAVDVSALFAAQFSDKANYVAHHMSHFLRGI
jgi:glycosyltransferase involved in cell wall biosynthesis